MFGKKSALSPLESRKQLLIAESEINRASLHRDWHALTNELGHLADQAKSFNTLTASVMSLVSGLAAFTSGKPAPEVEKTSWLQKVFKGAKLATTIWQLFRPIDANSKTGTRPTSSREDF